MSRICIKEYTFDLRVHKNPTEVMRITRVRKMVVPFSPTRAIRPVVQAQVMLDSPEVFLKCGPKFWVRRYTQPNV